MTPRDIILANLNHTNPPRPGMTFDHDRINDVLLSWPDASRTYTPKRWQEGKKEFYDDEWGNIWVRMVDGCARGEIHQPVLDTWDKLDTFVIPDYTNEARYSTMRDLFSRPTDKFKMAGIGGWIFDNARYLRKMEVYFMDMALYPDELKRLHSMVAKVYEARIHGAGKAGADGIFIGEDMGTQNGLLFSPDMFREYFKPDYTRLMGIAHDYGMKIFMHSCGKNWEIIDDLIDCGVDCFQFDQPAIYDMEALARKFRSRKVALWSPVDIQKVLPTGNKAFIEKETLKMLNIFDGCLLTKNYPDLPGIGINEEWDMWAYNAILEFSRSKGVTL